MCAVVGSAAVALVAALSLGACGGTEPAGSGSTSGQVAPTVSTKPASDSTAAGSGTKSAGMPASAATAKLEACKLVTKDEMVAVTGPVGDPKEEPPLVDMMASCRFPNAESPVAAEVKVSVVTYANAVTAASEMKNTIQRNKYEEVSGLASRRTPPGHCRESLPAKDATTSPSMWLPANDGETKAQNIARTQTLLEKALPRVP